MTPLTAAMLRRYSEQVEQQIDEYAYRLEDLEDENERLKDQITDLENQVTDLIRQLDAVAEEVAS